MHRPLRTLLGIAAVAALAVTTSCGREVTGAVGEAAIGLPGVHPHFPAAFGAQGLSASVLVPFAKVRVHLERADSTTAFDSTYDFGSSLDSLSIGVRVKLGAAAPRAGEAMRLSLFYINENKDTVFRGGPATVVATPVGADLPPPTPVEIAVHYTGAGAGASRVSLSPRVLEVVSGDAFTFTARTLDASGQEVPGAPVLFRSLDTLNAPLSRYSSGSGLARGAAGTIGIVATMLNGAADTAQLIIARRPSRLRIISGGNQSAVLSTVLPQPVVVRVVDETEQGVIGVAVSFTPSTGGSLTSATTTTDAEGYARATWKLGATAGAQSLTVASGTLLGSPFAVSATATTPVDTSRNNGNGNGSGNGSGSTTVDLGKTKLSIVSGDGQLARVSTALAEPVVVQLLDATGNAVPNVSIDWTTSGNDGSPATATTTTDAKGMSSNKWVLGPKDGAMRLRATLTKAGGVSTEFTATALAVTAAPPGKLVFATGPSTVPVGATMTPAVVVEAFDARGKHDSTFTGRVTIALVSPTGAARLKGNATATATFGLAVFDGLQFDAPESGLTLVATADGVTGATSSSFTVSNPPARLKEISGGNQQAKPSAALGKPLVVEVDDSRGKGLPGITVTWTVLTGGGRITTSAVTDANGQASASWTLGATAGTQTAQASVAGVPGSPIVFSATAR